jgi:hypothetical protein
MSFSTTSGTVATRFSPGAVSAGMPMRIFLSCIFTVVLCSDRNYCREQLLARCDYTCTALTVTMESRRASL